jgi:phosphoserine phosphatase
MPLATHLFALLERAREAPPPHVWAVATDADGTLWDTDVGDALFLEAARRGLVGAGLAALRRYAARLGADAGADPTGLARDLYERYQRDLIDVATMCELEAICLGDRPAAEFDALVEDVAREAARHVRADIRALLVAAHDAGARVHVVSASLASVVVATLRAAEIPFDTVAGAVLARAGDRVAATLTEPAPLFDGKVSALARTGSWPAALGLGDGGWDHSFLRAVHVPVLVHPKPRLVAAMADVPRAVRLE